jgi:hypothetical protein
VLINAIQELKAEIEELKKWVWLHQDKLNLVI